MRNLHSTHLFIRSTVRWCAVAISRVIIDNKHLQHKSNMAFFLHTPLLFDALEVLSPQLHSASPAFDRTLQRCLASTPPHPYPLVLRSCAVAAPAQSVTKLQ